MRKLGMMMALGAALLAPSAGAADSARRDRVAEAVPPPAPGMGQVVFYRAPIGGKLLKCRVSEGFDVLNRLPPGRYFIQPATPGIHEYEIRSDLLRVEVKAGETHYVRCAVNGVAVPALSVQDREDFDRYIRGLDLLPPWTGEKDKGD